MMLNESGRDLEEAISQAMANPELGLQCLQAADAQDSLMDFIDIAWPVLEPGTKFVSGTVVEVIAEHLEAVAKGKIRRLLINVPPGCMKSLGTDVFWPAWLWGPQNRPDKRFVAWSYAEDLTVRDNKKMRRLIQSEEYRKFWGDRFELTGDQNAKKLFENSSMGFKLAAGIHGQGTGHRGDFLVIDDPHNVKKAESELIRNDVLHFFTEVLPTRVNNKDSAIVVIMQRVHENDVSGHILANDLGYDHLCLPMEYESDHPFPSKTALGFKDWRTKEGELLWPERFDLEQIEELKKVLRSWGGDYAVAGQLQQRPVPRGGGMFKRKDLIIVDSAPEVGMECRGWDLAASDDHGAYTVGLKMLRHPQHGYFITDVARGQWSAGQVERNLLKAAEDDGRACWQSLPQDPGQSGKSQKRTLANLLSGFKVHFSPETGSKPDRARPWAAQAEAGNVHLVKGPWNEELIRELTVFPNSTFKDQADAGSRAFAFLSSKKPKNPGAAPRAA